MGEGSALFVPSSAGATVPERNWSDLVAVGGRLGFGWGKQIPFVLGLDASWAPGVTYRDNDGHEWRGGFRVGGFLGFNVPFLDLN